MIQRICQICTEKSNKTVNSCNNNKRELLLKEKVF